MQLKLGFENRYQLINLILSIPVAVFMAIRLFGFGISMPLSLFCVLCLVLTVGVFIFSKKLTLFPKKPIIFVSFFLLGFLFDPSKLFCDLSNFAVANLIYFVGAIGNGILLGYIADELFDILKTMKFKLTKSFWITAIAFNIFAIIYTLNSEIVYYWDNAGYWDIAKNLSEFNSGFFMGVISSVQFSDYNELIALPIALIMRVFGDNRLVFVLAIVNLYLLPSYAILFQIAKNHLLIALLSPAVLFLALTGFVDVGSLLIATFCIYFVNADILAKKRYFAIGIFSVLTFVLRRYYMFYAFAFLAAVFCVEWVLKPSNRKSLWVLFVTPLSTAFYFMQPFVLENVFLTNLGNRYIAYQLGLMTDVYFFIRYFGLLWLILAVVATVIAIKKRNVLSIICGVTFLICFVLFTSVQTHGQQHLLMYFPLFFVLISEFSDFFKSKKVQISLLTLALFTTLNVFVPRVQPQRIEDVRGFHPLPTFSLLPQSRDDIDELVALHKFVDSLSSENQISDVVLLSSSLQLNVSTMQHLYRSLNMPTPEIQSNWLIIPEIDERDTFESPIFNADYILVATPLQLHREPEHQDVVSEPYEQLMNGEVEEFEKLEESFSVGEITVFVFRNLTS